MDDFVQTVTTAKDGLLQHWPFIATVAVMTVIGQFSSTRLFTRARAYEESKRRWFWYWGRETLPIHPVLTGCLLGIVWRDPEGVQWPLMASIMYFAMAGVVSLFAWIWFKAYAKKKGYVVVLPGDSIHPESKEPPQ